MMKLLRNKRILLVACAASAYAIECVAQQNTTKHVVTALLYTGCTIYGGHLTYDSALKAAAGIQLALKDGAKVVKDKAVEELAKSKF